MNIPLTPLDLVRRGLHLYPNKVAVIEPNGPQYTYQQWGQRIFQLARAIQKAHFGGKHVAVLSPNTHRGLLAYSAVPWAGCVLVPLNTRLVPEEYAFQLKHAEVRLLLVDESLHEKIKDVAAEQGIEVWVMGNSEAGKAFEEKLAAEDGTPLPIPVEDEDDTITINFTSGTTSNPKGVMLTHRNTQLNAIETLYYFKYDQDTVYLRTNPDFHANGWGCAWSLFGVGATHITLPAVRAEAIYNSIEQYGVTHLCAAPTVLSILTDPKVARKVAREIRVVTAGSPPHARTIADMNNLGFHIMQVYGLTEVSPLITVAELSAEQEKLPIEERASLISKQGVEMILAGEVDVLDQQLQPVPHDGKTLGEIMVRGNLVMKGYYNNPVATEAALEGGWFRTGDVAVTHADGHIEIKDRNKDVIISGGENISSVEVEGILYAHPAVREAVVVAMPDEKWGELPCAFIALQQGQEATPEELNQHVREHLAGFKAPKRYEFREDLPKTASGKFQKFILRAELWEGKTRGVN